MPVLNKYRLYCNTESSLVYGYSNIVPTKCFNNIEHSIDSSSITVVQVVSTEILQASDEDNRQIVATSILPKYMYMYYTSQADDMVNGIRGEGTIFKKVITHNDTSPTIVQFQFMDPITVTGGFLKVNTMNVNDYVDMGLVAPATAVTINNNNTGNCSLYPYKIGYIIIAMNGNGTHNVDITSPLNANLLSPTFVSKAVPIPAHNYNFSVYEGSWDWDQFTGVITPNYNGDGQYHLMTFQIDLVKFVHHWFVWSPVSNYTHEFLIPQKGQLCLPQWKWRATVTRDETHSVGTPSTQIITITSSALPSSSGIITIYYKGQICTIINYDATIANVKSQIESSLILTNLGGVTATATANINTAATNTITIVFTEEGLRDAFIVESTLSDGITTKWANVTVTDAGSDPDPDIAYLWSLYLGRRITPSII